MSSSRGTDWPIAVEVEAEPVQAVIDVLTSLLAEARAGRIRQIGIATVDARGSGDTVIGRDVMAESSLLPLIGCASRLVHNLNKAQDALNGD